MMPLVVRTMALETKFMTHTKAIKLRHISKNSQAFEEITNARHAVKKFKSDPIDKSIVLNLLKMAISSPSSFNMQPYKILIVESPEIREVLAQEAMLGANGNKVRKAPILAVFLSLRDPSQQIDSVIELEKRNGTDTDYLKSMKFSLDFMLRKGSISRGMKIIATHLMSPLKPSPNLAMDVDSWSVKQTIFAAQTFILAATSYGLGTAPMEGFDQRRVCSILDIPQSQFTVPVMISIGYIADEELQKKRIRFELEDMCFADKYGKKF